MEALVQFIPIMVLTAFTMIPCWRLVKRLGMSPAWVCVVLFPLLGMMVFFWVVAFVRWGIKDAEELAAIPMPDRQLLQSD